ncbi:omega-amidase NIT2-like [Drosophila nasuta]|uniref:omega-amidase NIT2-like n=1 Tax=Drosophila nasuta TaxID=42062 RepID=UPI00295E9871|nr:omega-amidase NIT2-like [Drosophila nasuta]
MSKGNNSNSNKLTLAVLQLPGGSNVSANVRQAVEHIAQLKAANPQLQLAILPESFNGPYAIEEFGKHAESVPDGPTCRELSQLAKKLAIYIIGGSIIERDANNKLYNTCTVWSPTGKLIGRHRKIHLFTMHIEPDQLGGVYFDESAALTAGNEPTVVEIGPHKVGIGICHDKRFEELARIYRNMGCSMLVYPSAFCICQGPMHWELLQRARAHDNQLFVVTCAPARNNMSGYVAYGHSMIVDPWARVQREAGDGFELMVEEIDFNKVDEVRRQIPIFKQRRTDVYDLARAST